MAVVSVYLDPPDLDLSVCAYFRRGEPGADPNGICSFGCREEPACVTDRPLEGWPAERGVLDPDHPIVIIHPDRPIT